MVKELDIVIWPDLKLQTPSEEVKKIDQEILELIDDMKFTMKSNNGIGLAAVQVNVMKKIIVMDLSNMKNSNYNKEPISCTNEKGDIIEQRKFVMINAKIIEHSKEVNSLTEGCLSLPRQSVQVTRYNEIKVEFLDENGTNNIYFMTGILARCAQHEIDHTNGIIFIFRIPAAAREIIDNRMIKIKKEILSKRIKKI